MTEAGEGKFHTVKPSEIGLPGPSRTGEVKPPDPEKVLPGVRQQGGGGSGPDWDKIAELIAARVGEAVSGAVSESLTRQTGYESLVRSEWMWLPVTHDFDNWPPPYYKEVGEQGQTLLRVRKRIANAAAHKYREGTILLEEAKGNPFLKEGLRKGEFFLLYNMPGFRDALEFFGRELFEGYWELYGEGAHARYRLRIKTGAEDLLNDETKYDLFRRQALAFVQQKLQSNTAFGATEVPRVEDQAIAAMAAVAAVTNLCFALNTWESADDDKKVDGLVNAEPVKNMMHPLRKAWAKMYKTDVTKYGTEEAWGGDVSVWLVNEMARNPSFRNKIARGEIKPFPETMFASVWELVDTGKFTQVGAVNFHENLAFCFVPPAVDAFRDTRSYESPAPGGLKASAWAAKEIPFNGNSRIPVNILGYYGDIWDTAYKGYQYATGKVELKGLRLGPELKAPIDKWASGLGDIIAKMKGNPLVDYFDDPNYIAWCIASSTGLERNYDRPILSVPSGIPYDVLLDTILMPRLVDPAKKVAVKDILSGSLTRGGLQRSFLELRRTIENTFQRS